VFLDAGSNKGVHGRFLFEPEQYPQSKFVGKFTQHFGPVEFRRNSTCVFAFEPNPLHREHQVATMRTYNALGWRYHYLPVGVGDRPGQIRFFRNNISTAGEAHEEWGFSTTNMEPNNPENIRTSVSSDVIDFARFVAVNILERSIPKLNTKLPPTVMMKMDIEGYEYRVLSHMLVHGVLCKINVILGETHHHTGITDKIFPMQISDHMTLRYPEQAEELMTHINGVLKAASCPDFFHEFDDENYLYDPVPLPKVPQRALK
jgi:FkbM family methyltransferase